jgi:hypothetical protein
MAADTSSAAGAVIAVVWLAAAALALRNAEPKLSKFPLAEATLSGIRLKSDITFPPWSDTVTEAAERSAGDKS